ncbi:amidase [Antricoccus suffuscus]|uniref:Amidase n=1 Tax=Antricoccus suffuscus TaxID=1629062 RepID=A0A2T0ZX67_9ACTN|nr:amidase [Antricoccus suffuscus]PRZ40678.1 amidase [Antricoccus suffuscus]
MTDICFLPATELAAAMSTGELSSREVTQAFLDQIDRVNPQINAVVTLAADSALAAADAADVRRTQGDSLPVLHGMPMLHKDTHATAGIRTTSGSPLLADNVPDTDELLIERLHTAGAISMGKTNVPEFAAGSHTFNPVFGTTYNPYGLTKTVGGSSGGAAASLATGMTALADGSDMGGSLRNPAAFCNVVGLRPTTGRVPSEPGAFGHFSLSVQGPMARSVEDVALLLSAMAGPDLRAPATLDEPGASFARIEPMEPGTLRIAISADFGGLTPVEAQIAAAINKAGETFASLGADVHPAMLDLSGANEAFLIRRGWQFAANFGPLLDAHPGGLKDSIVWNVERGRELSGADLARAMALTAELYQRTREFFTEYDALLLPTTQVSPFDTAMEYPTQINGQPLATYLEWMRSCSDISATGAPAISMPAGFTDDGLPIGLQIVTQYRAEKKLLQIARLFETATRYAETRPPVC